MKKVLIRIVMFMMLTMILTGYADENAVYADSILSSVPTYYYDGYDYTMSFAVTTPTTESGRYHAYANVKKMDFIVADHCIDVGKCPKCGYEYGTLVEGVMVNIDGYYAFHKNDTSSWGAKDLKYWSTGALPLTNAKYLKDDQPTDITLILGLGKVECGACRQSQRDAVLHMNELKFIDKRGVASMKESSYTVQVGGSLNVEPSYNEYTDHVAWGVKYPGETCYTLLSEGTNRDGLVASGVNNRAVSLSNIPYVSGGFDLGVFVFDKDNQLPGNTTIQNTPFYSHIDSPDSSAPTISVIKTPSEDGKSVMVTINATDKEGLHVKPISWDGGSTYTEESSKKYTKIGTFQIAVRDAAGNVTKSSFYIDSNDLKGSAQSSSSGSSGQGTSITDKTPTTSSGGNTSGTGSSGGTNNNGGSNGNTNGTTGNGSGGTAASNANNAGTGSLNSVVTSGGSESIKGGTVSSNQTTNTGSGNAGTGNAGSGNAGTGSGTLAVNDPKTGSGSGKSKGTKKDETGAIGPEDISDTDSSEVFDRIRQNSKDYIIAMHEDYSDEERFSGNNDSDSLNVQELEAADELNDDNEENDESGIDYTDSGNSDSASVKPLIIRNSPAFKIIIILLGVLLVAVISYILFFGVLILYEKETEFSTVSKTKGPKVPAGLTHITYSDGRFSICFRELLVKHDVLYVRPGVLFAYMFEGEKIGIETKFKGDKKREIAVETVHREIVIGNKNKGGKKA